MRGCCLFIILLGLIGSVLMILFGSIFNFSFNWQDWLIYLVIAVIVYITVLIIGNSLNKQFDELVDNFIIGEKEKLIEKGPFSAYGFLLIVLLPFLIYLMLFGLYSSITSGIYGFWLMSGASRIPIILPIALIVIVFGTAIAIIIGFYFLLFPPRRKPIGIELTKTDEPKLWGLVHEVAKSVGAKPVNKIVATPFPGIGVYLNGNFISTLFGGGERVLEIGFSSIYNLKIGEFKAILAHEYGHFSNKDTQWGSFTYSMGNSLISTLRSMPGPSENTKDGTLGALLTYNPAYWILYYFVKLYFKITNGFSRVREVLADKRACELYGGKNFSNGLKRVALNDSVFTEIVEAQYVPELLKNQQVFTDFSRAMGLAYDKSNEKIISNLEENILKFQGDESFTTHPRMKTRMEYSKRFEDKELKVGKEKVEALFDNWDARNQEITSIYNYIYMARNGLLNQDGTVKDISTEQQKLEELDKKLDDIVKE